MRLYVPVAAGLEAVVKRQLGKLGYGKASAENGRISLEGTWEDVARLNVFLRSGERVLIGMGTRKVTTFDELYDFAYSVPWEDWIDPAGRIVMDGKSTRSQLAAVKASGGVVKKAIVRRIMQKKCPQRKALPENGARYVVGLSLFSDEATLTLDTSGDSLHKRGYRTLAYTAPIKETLAAGMIDMSIFHREKPFADLFCGSGTLPIEAALKAYNIAPGMSRDFDFMLWKYAPQNVVRLAREEAADVRDFSKRTEIYGCDISPKAISVAKYHARRAGVEKLIRFETRDMRLFSSKSAYGVIVSNPPYGERIGEAEEVRTLYRDLGTVYRALPDWSIYVLTAFKEFERYFGKRAEKKRKLYNANLECGLYCYTGAKPPKGCPDDNGTDGQKGERENV